MQSKLCQILKKEKCLEKKYALSKLEEILQKKVKLNENEFEDIVKTLIDKGFVEYQLEKQILVYIP